MFQRHLKLIGYLRNGHAKFSVEEQKGIITDYCERRNYRLEGYTEADKNDLSYGWEECLEALQSCDGIITTDASCLVENEEDRLVKLRPLFKNFMDQHKQLITILDGLDTSTADGQKYTIDLLEDWTEQVSEPRPTRTEFETEITE